MDVAVIIPAAGSGSRMGAGHNKALLPLAGQPMLAWSLELFQQSPAVREIIVAASAKDRAVVAAICRPFPKVKAITLGGESRAASVAAALRRVSPSMGRVAVHDAARPLLHKEDWQALLAAAARYPAAILAAPLVDSIKQVRDGRVLRSLNRSELLAAGTPQIFAAPLLRTAYKRRQDNAATDDAALVEALGVSVRLVEARHANFKLTYAHDLLLAEQLLGQRQAAGFSPGRRFRIGQGWDSHALVSGRKLKLGGVEVESPLGLLGHSDGDALLHAIIDALLGGAGLPDIGQQFPDTDPAYAGVSSLALLAKTGALLKAAGWEIVNIDSTILAQQPRLAPYLPAMAAAVSQALGISPGQVGVKAKTAEGLGPVGQGRSMEAMAVVLLQACPAIAPGC